MRSNMTEIKYHNLLFDEIIFVGGVGLMVVGGP